ncbi:MAG: nucleoside 2-deoxyribosyltransferase [Acidobacteria bacterium]|nr:nucleoside 2-deoxyribosyltransferase [Acidobacteriota bacterium]
MSKKESWVDKRGLEECEPSPKIEAPPKAGGGKRSCFVIMSFSGSGVIESYYEAAIKPTILKQGLTPVRVDQNPDTREVMEQIRDGIERSAVVIADLTQDRPNCYFEAGYAVALAKPVIFQRLDAPPEFQPKFPFDVQGYPHILYRDFKDLRTKLKEMLAHVLKKLNAGEQGGGPKL